MSYGARRTLLQNLLGLVRIVRTPLAALAVSLVLATAWAPLLFGAFTLEPYASGVVRSTDRSSDTVVELDSGEFAAATSVDAAPGERVELFQSSADSTVVGHDSLATPAAFTALLGALAALVTAGALALLGEWLLPKLERRVQSALR